MEGTYFSETPIVFQRTTWPYNNTDERAFEMDYFPQISRNMQFIIIKTLTTVSLRSTVKTETRQRMKSAL